MPNPWPIAFPRTSKHFVRLRTVAVSFNTLLTCYSVSRMPEVATTSHRLDPASKNPAGVLELNAPSLFGRTCWERISAIGARDRSPNSLQNVPPG